MNSKNCFSFARFYSISLKQIIKNDANPPPPQSLTQKIKGFNLFKFSRTLTVFTSIALIISSCNEDTVKEILPSHEQNIVNNYSSLREVDDESLDNLIVLGKKLQNPYTVEVMKQASKNVAKDISRANDVKIKENFYYYRFLPSNEKENKAIKETGVELYNYPLDYEIEKRGKYFKDKELGDSEFIWLYAAVPVDIELPNIKKEKLADLYIPEEDLTLKSDQTLTSLLVDEAMRLTGNFEEKKGFRATNNYPSGNIQFYDNVMLNWRKLIGVKVRAKRWFTTKEVYTDVNGNFFINHNFNGSFDLSIKWETGKYDIRDGDVVQAEYVGPQNTTSPWNLSIHLASGKQRVFACVHRAAHLVYYGTTLVNSNIQTPGNEYIRVKDIGNTNSSGLIGEWGPYSGVAIWPSQGGVGPYGGGRLRSDIEIFGTTAHELGHKVHFAANSYTWWQFNNKSLSIISESWGELFKHIFQQIEYGKSGRLEPSLSGSLPYKAYDDPSNFTDKFQTEQANNQISPENSKNSYVPLFVDLMDNINQRTTPVNYSINANDLVSGYTLNQLHIALINGNSYNSIRDYLVNNFYNPSEQHVNDLFTEWYQ